MLPTPCSELARHELLLSFFPVLPVWTEPASDPNSLSEGVDHSLFDSELLYISGA
jgi:hypothetical protein